MKALIITIFIIPLNLAFFSFCAQASSENSHAKPEEHHSDEANHADEEHHADEGHHSDEDPHTGEAHHDDDAHHEDEGHHQEEGDHHGHGGGKAIGEGKAILEVDEDKGFRLAPKAIQTIGVKTEPVGSGSIRIPKSALVHNLNSLAFYRLRDGFFKRIEVEAPNPRLPKEIIVSAPKVLPGDSIVTEGLDLLRVSDVYSTDKSEYGHGH